MSSSESEAAEHEGGATALEVRLSVDPSDDCGCSGGMTCSEDVRQSMTTNGDGDWTCHLIVGEDAGSEFVRNDVCDACPCYLFTTHECVAEVVDVRNGRIHYSVIVPDRSKIAPLVERLRATGAEVSVHRILVAGDRESEAPTLTDKQRETVELAIEQGYFDRPRGTSLEEIADELGVTPSAVSQRLNSVNRRLVRRFAEDACLDRPE